MSTNTMTLSTYQTFKTTMCITCGATIAIVSDVYDHLLTNRASFYCPSGHSQCFVGKSVEEQLREKLANAESELARRKADIESKDRSIAALRGQAKRQKTRLLAGVCPCCNRTFSALARHMSTKHPDWKSQDIG